MTAANASGTLTLDSALPAAPTAGTPVLLTPPDPAVLTGSLPAGANTLGATALVTQSGAAWVSQQGTEDGQKSPITLATAPFNLAFNGSSWDRVYNNTQGPLIASAARTGGATSPTMTNYNARGVVVYLYISAVPATPSSGTGLYIVVEGTDPVSGNPVQLNDSPSLLTLEGIHAAILYPGDTSGGGASAGQAQHFPTALPREWGVSITAATTDSYTFSVGYSLIN
ncbi:MAG: hypothetical protein ACYCPS_05340 [Candidatus Saccharimonadales bacterium]